MDKDYIVHIAESKVKYHRAQARLPYEEKFKIILTLQKIDCEMRRNNKSRKTNFSKIKVWQPEE